MALFGRKKPGGPPVVPLMFGTEQLMPPGIEIPAEQHPVFRRIAEDLVVAYAFDGGPAYEMVNSLHLADIGTIHDLHARALETLRARAKKELTIAGGDSRYRVILDGPSRDLTASLVLAPDLYRSRMPLASPVIGLGSRVWMHVVDGTIPAEVEGLRELTANLHDAGEAKPINRWLYLQAPDGSLTRV